MEYMELELRLAEPQGAHKIGGRSPHPLGQGVGPLVFIFCEDFLYFLKLVSEDFFLHETEYMELELRSAEPQGAHEIGGRAQGVGAAPTLVDRVWAPWSSSFVRIFYIF